ncbi:MAG: hypothetical protein FWE03_03870 [Firmicutes bacterium]|nr:hypothetical protein [Bacillota bacterium]
MKEKITITKKIISLILILFLFIPAMLIFAACNINNDRDFFRLSTGGRHTLYIDNAGNLWAWGDNSRYQLGGFNPTGELDPVHVNTGGRMNNARIVSVAAGWEHNLAIDEFGNLWAWGQNDRGQLGDATTTNRATPIRVNTGNRMNNARIISIAVGGRHSLAIDEFGFLWSWGDNGEIM